MVEAGDVFPRYTRVWTFNVGRGLAVFVHSALNQGILYDLGASDEFSPTDFIDHYLVDRLDKYAHDKSVHSIAQAVLSHPHSDHISEIDALGSRPRLYPTLLTCPHDRTPEEAVNWKRIRNPKGSEGRITIYQSLFAKRTPPLQTIQYTSPREASGLEYGLYYIRPPVVEDLYPSDDQEYGNATSIMMYLRHGPHSLLIPADMPPVGMERVLRAGPGVEKRFTVFDHAEVARHPNGHQQTSDQPNLARLLRERGLSVLVAPHHGLESGYSDLLYQSMKGGKPGIVVISEKRHLQPTDGTVDPRYQSSDGASGLDVMIEGVSKPSYSISTRNGHHILVVLPGFGAQPRIYAEKDPTKLLYKG